jgi:hypothetical protein
MSPDDVREMKAAIESLRTTSAPYDIVVGGGQRRAGWEQERALIRSLAEAGTTWWVEYVPPAELDVMRQAISRGPLRID